MRNNKGQFKQLTLEEIYEYFKIRNYEFIKWTDEYRNYQSMFVLKCTNGHLWETNLKKFRNGNANCPYCKTIIDLSFCKQEFKDKNYTLLAKEYTNNITEMPFICNLHPEQIQYTTRQKFKLAKDSCIKCREERNYGSSLRKDGEFVINQFQIRNYLPLFSKEEYKNNHHDLPYICSKHEEKGVQYITYHNLSKGEQCYWCSLESRSGENHYDWKGGIKPIIIELKSAIKVWKIDSMKNSDYKCVITGIRANGKFHIHHLYCFEFIVNELFKSTNIVRKNVINEYPQEEISTLKEKCLELHYKYGLGVCLHPKIHKLFHSLYSYGKNTSEQFEEFKTRLKSGEFNNFLQENNLKLTI
jgi:hypothetical protein